MGEESCPLKPGACQIQTGGEPIIRSPYLHSVVHLRHLFEIEINPYIINSDIVGRRWPYQLLTTVTEGLCGNYSMELYGAL